MFLNSLVSRNPEFIRAAVALHRDGKLPSNTYVLDLDTMRENARQISTRAHELGLSVWAMSKQFGRNPPALQAVVEGGVDGFVAVDVGCLLPIAHGKHTIGNIGHVVQIPRHDVPRAIAADPRFWTIYSLDKAEEVSSAAAEQGRNQQLLARVYGPGDSFYPGQEGGFAADSIDQVIDAFSRLNGASFAGLTTFPAVRYNSKTDAIEAAPNAKTVERVASRLSELGVTPIEINAPGNTSSTVLDLLASLGATQVEPGHGLTGSTPIHARHELPERPASLYLSEISHEHAGVAYAFGGGLYVDPVFSDYQLQALVGSSADAVLSQKVDVTLPPIEGIDYYAMLKPSRAKIATGDTVVLGFRMQAFVTRAFVAPVSGVSEAKPKVEGIWTTSGMPVDWPEYDDYLSATSAGTAFAR